MGTDPRDPLQQAHALYQRGMLTEAEAAYQDILRHQPDTVDALHMAGVVALQTGRPAQGLALIGRALQLDARNAAAHSNLGAGLQALGRYADALASYDRAIELRPGYAEVYANRSGVLMEMGQFDAALASCDRAIALRPDSADAFFNRGNALTGLRRHIEAMTSYDRAILLNPRYAEAYANRGNAFSYLQSYRDALASYDHAIALKPDYAEAHSNRGVVLREMQRHAEALTSYDRALALQPDHVEANWNKGLCLLAIGDYADGWRYYEWRKQRRDPVASRVYPQPIWRGQESLAGKTLFIHWEQGLGDTLQFCRYANLATARGARVMISVADPLQRLLGTLAPDIEVLAETEVPAAFDYHCPMMSLPLAFGTTVETVPCAIPYLAADPAAVTAWRERLGAAGGLRVGLCWAGNPRPHENASYALDRRRSIALARYGALAAIPGVRFVSLQKGEAAAETAAPPAGLSLHDWTGELNDFADTAALVEALDLVITVDTSVAHLAGALGKPVWILNRFDACWRWLVGREDSPWYPTARLFHQPRPGDWDSVMAEVAAALRVHEFAADPAGLTRGMPVPGA